MREPWIRLQDLEVVRGGRSVLHRVSAELTGSAIGLVGANGAGKSTLIGTLLGVLKPISGQASVLGLSLPTQAMEVRTRAGVMAEQAGIFPGGSGVDAVTFAGTLSGLDRREALRRAHRALDALAVGEERYRSPSEYSTGMRQRCKLAMSLVHDPELLILDEPTVGLDPPGRMQLLRLIRQLRDDGRRILLSTHIMADAEFVCDEMLLIRSGQVAFCGPTRRLVGEGGGVIRVRGDGFDEGFGSSLAGSGYRVLTNDASEITFEATNDPDLHEFWKIAASAGVSVRSLKKDLPTLEEAVVEAMQGGERHE